MQAKDESSEDFLPGAVAKVEALDARATVRVVESLGEQHIRVDVATAGEELEQLLAQLEHEETREDLEYIAAELDAYADEVVEMLQDPDESILDALEGLSPGLGRRIAARALTEYAHLRRELFLGVAKEEPARIDAVVGAVELQTRLDNRSLLLPALPALLSLPASYAWHLATRAAETALLGPDVALLRDAGYAFPWLGAALLTAVCFPGLRILGELTASWEPGREGTLLGARELSENLATVRRALAEEDLAAMPLGLAARLRHFLPFLLLFGFLPRPDADAGRSDGDEF
eukprot:tig00001299_g8064.t1